MKISNSLRKMTLAVLGAFGLTLSLPGGAANLFVEAGASGASCTAAESCASIQAAVDLASPGDQIIIGDGVFAENIRILPGKDGITLTGGGQTVIDSSGGIDGVCAPCPTTPADVVLDIFAADVVIKNLSIVHSGPTPTKRDIGVFVRPPASGVTLKHLNFRRDRSGEAPIPGPGSRGVFAFLAPDLTIKDSTFRGSYQDSIHIPASNVIIKDNDIADTPRVGIVIIQEPAGSPTVDSLIAGNAVTNTGGDGIQIQGDNNVVKGNTVTDSAGAGIKLCGAVVGDCVDPGDTQIAAVAEDNIVNSNTVSGSGGGDVVDNGIGNLVK
ncbi:MAG: right-handed parallel beta-helix repeat-containing protein [Gammaproteobacteria bacterium]|nr:right-handed parallel beta-helix repeat-containing protein [Gammaproteobacteria bacterium]